MSDQETVLRVVQTLYRWAMTPISNRTRLVIDQICLAAGNLVAYWLLLFFGSNVSIRVTIAMILLSWTWNYYRYVKRKAPYDVETPGL